MWLNALYAAQRELLRQMWSDVAIQSQGRLLRRAQQILEQWKENKEHKFMESKKSDSD